MAKTKAVILMSCIRVKEKNIGFGSFGDDDVDDDIFFFVLVVVKKINKKVN